MKSLLLWLVKLLVATLVVAGLLVVIAVVVADKRGGSNSAWITSMLIYGGAVLLMLGALIGTSGNPAFIRQELWNTRSSGLPLSKGRSPTVLVLLVPLAVIGIGVLAHLYL